MHAVVLADLIGQARIVRGFNSDQVVNVTVRLLTHLPSCAFAQPHSTSLQSMAIRLILLLGSLVHTQEGLATILTSNFDPAGRRVLQHDMQDEDRLLHAVPARRWPFGIIC